MSKLHPTCLLAWAVTTLLLVAPRPLCLANESDTRSGAEATSHPSVPAAARPCVLLTNGHVLYGDAIQRGEWVVIRNGDGNESQLPRQNVACWAPSITDLYQYRVDHRPPGNLNAIARDAMWCLDYELYQHAAALIDTIRKLDPDNAQALSLERQLQHRTAAADASTPTSPVVQTTSHLEPAVAAVKLPELKSFAGQVQPMLANRCGLCHSDPSVRQWSLALPPHGARPSSRMTRDNLQRCLDMINVESPSESLLYTKAVSAHGGVDAPLDSSDVRAIESLRTWIDNTAAWIVAGSRGETSDEPTTNAVPVGWAMADQTSVPTASVPTANVPSANTSSASAPERPTKMPGVARLPQVANPFDPELFNRKYHPPLPPEADSLSDNDR